MFVCLPMAIIGPVVVFEYIDIATNGDLRNKANQNGYIMGYNSVFQ